MKSSKANFVTWTFRLPLKRQLSILLNFFLSIYRYWIFFPQVLNFNFFELNRFAKQAEFFLNLLFQKRRWTYNFLPKKTLVTQKQRAISRQKKMAFSTPSGCLWTPLPLPPQSVQTDVRTHGRTLTSQPKFLASMGCQIFLPMVLCSALCVRMFRY